MAEDRVTTMLMFAGRAEEAIRFYTGLFPNSSIESIERYGPDFPQGPAGQVVHARFTLSGQPVMAMDSAVEQPFTFTPSTSFFVTCDSGAEVDRLYHPLAGGGRVMMELGAYPFATRYAWVEDRFGVSWQLFYRRAPQTD